MSVQSAASSGTTSPSIHQRLAVVRTDRLLLHLMVALRAPGMRHKTSTVTDPADRGGPPAVRGDPHGDLLGVHALPHAGLPDVPGEPLDDPAGDRV